MRWATIYGPNGFRYTFSDEDYDWFVRMVGGEASAKAWRTPEGHAIQWTVVNRYVDRTIRDVIPERALWEEARLFSQPINKRWATGGDLALLHPNPVREAHRDWLQSAPLSEVIDRYPGAPQIVADLMRGKIKAGRFARISDFLERGSTPGADDIGPLDVGLPRSAANEFYTEPGTKNWREGTVRIVSPRPKLAGIGLAAGILIGVVAIPQIVKALRRHRRSS